MRIKTLLIWLLSLVLVAGCQTMKVSDWLNFVLPKSGYTKQSVSYGTQPRQDMDVYVPKEPLANKPPIVFVYGGAWREGAKEDYTFVAQALTGLGYTVVIPNYRLYPTVQFPAFINDVAQSIAYLQQNALSLIGHPLQNFILMGHSSGAHTAALLATKQAYLREQGVSVPVVGLIALSGPYNLPLELAEVSQAFGAVSPEQVNPLLNIPPNMPLTLLLHGEADDRVKPHHTKEFAQRLQQTGHSVEVHLYPGVDHVKILASLAAPLHLLNPSYEDIKQFLAKY